MKIAAIDVGSNSVRLMMWADGKTLYKRLCTTRLGEGLSASLLLKEENCVRSAQAVADFYNQAESDGAECVYVFATAAVRSCANPQLFTDKVKALCGADVDILSGEREAEVGLLGALGSGDGGIIDVGGASTEVIVRAGGAVEYSQSVNVGTVRILNSVGRDLKKAESFIARYIDEFSDEDFSSVRMRAVGGTASRLACIKLGIKTYNASLIEGTTLTAEEINALAHKLSKMSVESIREKTICGSSADLIGGGAMLMYMVMKKFSVASIKVSESDNLEGYVLSKLK